MHVADDWASGKMEDCCVNEYCWLHCVNIRRGAIISRLFRVCGVGTQAECQLCKSRGGGRIGQKLRDTERRARKIYTERSFHH